MPGSAEIRENTEVVRRYLRVSRPGTSPSSTRSSPAAALPPGLSRCRVQVDDLFAAGDRVTVVVTLTYMHDRTGRDLTMSGIKSYRLQHGRIVEFWGETDLYGMLRQAGLLPEQIPSF